MKMIIYDGFVAVFLIGGGIFNLSIGNPLWMGISMLVFGIFFVAVTIYRIEQYNMEVHSKKNKEAK